MAFWGIEIGPSKTYVHKIDQTRGRLRITQATLGEDDVISTVKCTVNCTVGNKSPVLLCSLRKCTIENCHLELEFEEDEEVIFSVNGSCRIHLTGYYIGHGPSLGGDDSESYGEDIAESDNSDSYSCGSEDDYESDFIDDADVAIFTNSQGPKSSVVIEEIEDDDKQHRNFRRLKKKQEISDCEDVETGSKQLVVRNKESIKDDSEDDDGFPICFPVDSKSSKKKKINDDKKRKVDAISQNTVSVSEANVARDSTMPIVTASKKNEKSKKKKEKDEKSSIGTENDEKQNKQKENASMENKTETNADLSINEVKDTENDRDTVPVTPVDSNTSKQSKKKSKKRRIREEGVPDLEDSLKDDKIDTVEVSKENEIPVENPATTDDVNAVKKKKKKNKKKNNDSDIKQETLVEEKADLVNGVDELQNGSQAIKTRTFPNGLIVEEVSMGKPDGKKASPGKKVSVRYIGKLKNGTIFDSNVGQRPFKFRLGIGEVIKGWDVGVNGMCVGDKRKLTIPPAFGYGTKGVGKIPPNSWLVFDVELVDVQ